MNRKKLWGSRLEAAHRSGGNLQTPRTPVERIVLYAKLARLKRDYERRHGP